MRITILNRKKFKELMISRNITPSNVNGQENKNTYLISINNTHTQHTYSYFEEVYASNLLKLYFDDVTYNASGNVLFDSKMAKEVLRFANFIKLNETDNTEIIIHCSAGINRSGSIGKFLSDFFIYTYDRLMLENPQIMGNSVVNNLLYREWVYYDYD